MLVRNGDQKKMTLKVGVTILLCGLVTWFSRLLPLAKALLG
ncbi:hypothetical protein OENI_1690002 [Oenococcus oeni]|nr:hypothetical protein OENI_1690002 [Oenococcus oeni]